MNADIHTITSKHIDDICIKTYIIHIPLVSCIYIPMCICVYFYMNKQKDVRMNYVYTVIERERRRDRQIELHVHMHVSSMLGTPQSCSQVHGRVVGKVGTGNVAKPYTDFHICRRAQVLDDCHVLKVYQASMAARFQYWCSCVAGQIYPKAPLPRSRNHTIWHVAGMYPYFGNLI